MEHTPLIVVGAGQAGLATAHEAARRGVRPLVLEAADDAGGSWPHHYDSLTLFSPARFSGLPGRPMPGDGDRYPRRDEVVSYLRAYARDLDADTRYGQRVTGVGRSGGHLTVTTATGARFRTPALVAATGEFSRPHRPALPGLDEFSGTVLHSSEYRSPESFAGRRVVVVGGGNSAVQIAAELAATARVTLASRAPIAWMGQRLLGRDLHWWFVRSGLDTAPIRRYWERGPVLVRDDGRYRAAFDSGDPDRREMFTNLTEHGVEWADGTKEDVDALVLATGFRPALGYLDGTGALDGDGRPLQSRGVSASVPGLGFVGLEFQRSFSSATLRGVGRDARHVLRRIL
ncbi:putative flavoprotein involved in K+ transport [Nocardiopsis sp. Huas11]|uniref:flavin-containing monooxygenase n=1 Tax=Nocardiopsis sp. Huas11 TaxID=2183912 RepID=UPI000EAB7B85|nr:FAD-dependent oxidoreductase [Nocardiopsis sp. Huas11]RKS07140.1 putative flavoprotein involved in K+ transport [Nocardiopsis sp. Huas11]